MTREEGLRQIDEAKWVKDSYGWLELRVNDEKDRAVVCHLSLRPNYCDRGHFQFTIHESYFDLDRADSFPRFFFSPEEADSHVRNFLKWRIWKHRVFEHTLDSLIKEPA